MLPGHRETELDPGFLVALAITPLLFTDIALLHH